MRIVCPSCQAAYEVPEKLLSGPPKRVRCARCGEQWFPQDAATGEDRATPEPDAPLPADPPPPAAVPPSDVPPPNVPPPDVPPDPPPVAAPPVAALPVAALPVAAQVEERLMPEPPQGAGRGGLIVAGLAWLASLVLLGTAGWAAVAWRAEVMAAWGASRRLYQWLGLA